jgi:hypothetical protein
MKVVSVSGKVKKILAEYVLEKETYYRKKLNSKYPLKDIIQESMKQQDLPILKCLIMQEFPQYREFLFKHLVIQ